MTTRMFSGLDGGFFLVQLGFHDFLTQGLGYPKP